MRHRRLWRSLITSTFVTFCLTAMILPTLAAPQSGNTPSEATTFEDAPLAILFDVSGSMNETDSNGVNKLSAAKTSMTTMLREQSGTRTRLGLWTYPGTLTDNQGCQPGTWIPGLSPTQTPDPTDLDATIRTLSANGGTPTGPALSALIDSLKREGFTAATIILVSDGESNCGVPPCEVAQQAGAEGFKLHVPTVGFDISEQGRGELECIANATGSTYHDAEDAEKLITELEKYQPKDLRLEVNAPAMILPGANAQIIATIHNPSPAPVVGAKAILALDRGVSQRNFTTVLAPQRPLAAIPAGGSVTVKWIATSATNARGAASWKIAVGSPEAGTALATGTINFAENDLTMNDAGPLLKNLHGPVVVLGDSYSSGEGTGSYITNNKCHRSTLAYGAVLGGQTTDIIACSGATSADIRNRNQNDTELPQVQALSALTTPPGIVFMTIGGNDIGFADIVLNCLINDCASNMGAQRRKLSEITLMSESLEDTLRQVVEAANTPEWVAKRGAVAPLIVSPYPDLLWQTGRGTCASNTPVSNYGFSTEEMTYGRSVLMTLNRQLETAVDNLASAGYPIVYADSVLDFPQPSHTICDSDSYFVQLDIGNVLNQAWKLQLRELAHPNARGHRAWANELISWSQTDRASNVSNTMPDRPSRISLRGIIRLFENLISRAVSVKGELQPPTGDGSAQPGATHQRIDVRNADTIQLDLRGARPGSVITIVVHSTPTALGTIPVDEDGVAHGQVTIPHDLPTGSHTLVVSGLNDNFEQVLFETPLKVSTSLSLPLIAGVASLLFSTIGIALALLGRSQLRKAHAT